MTYYAIKIFLSALIIVIVSEVAKRSTMLGAFIASLPLTSILAIVWLYIDSRDLSRVSSLSYGIFIIVIPSLVFFILFPTIIKLGWSFWPSMIGSILITSGAYLIYSQILNKLNINF